MSALIPIEPRQIGGASMPAGNSRDLPACGCDPVQELAYPPRRAFKVRWAQQLRFLPEPGADRSPAT